MLDFKCLHHAKMTKVDNLYVFYDYDDNIIYSTKKYAEAIECVTDLMEYRIEYCHVSNKSGYFD
jgi:hypothetical protein